MRLVPGPAQNDALEKELHSPPSELECEDQVKHSRNPEEGLCGFVNFRQNDIGDWGPLSEVGSLEQRHNNHLENSQILHGHEGKDEGISRGQIAARPCEGEYGLN